MKLDEDKNGDVEKNEFTKLFPDCYGEKFAKYFIELTGTSEGEATNTTLSTEETLSEYDRKRFLRD
jgi:hypothetical protein